MRKILVLCAGAFLLGALTLVITPSGRNALWSVFTRVRGRATVEDRLAALAPEVESDIRAWCAGAGVPFPPEQVVLVGLKRERELHVYGRSGRQGWRWMATLPILGASGHEGPKLAEGDGQVPEGVYALESLHSNSRFHLALRIGYPNESDRRRAATDGRTELGGDIMIHGGSASIGCLAMGDPGIERLFALCAAAGPEEVIVVLAPCDLRVADAAPAPQSPAWISKLYEELRTQMKSLPVNE